MNSLALLIEVNTLRAIERICEGALPDETGGILIGYRTSEEVVVTHAFEIPDSDAGPDSYVRRAEPAQRRLDEFLASQPTSSLLGWVGDFHSHPADCRASPRDLGSLRENSQIDRSSLALLICARDRSCWRPYGYVANRGETADATVDAIGARE